MGLLVDGLLTSGASTTARACPQSTGVDSMVTLGNILICVAHGPPS